jgi:hypothetical protein
MREAKIKKGAKIALKLHLAPKSSRSTNAVDVKLTIIWEIIINNKRNLKTN